MRVWSTVLVVAIVFAALSAPAGAVTLTTALKASPASFTGGCPKKIDFTGSIATYNWPAGAAKIVQYRFERSDGYKGPVQTADFSSTAKQNVETTWTLGLPTQTKTGWVAVRTYYPQPAYSNQANFTLNCTGVMVVITIQTPPPPPAITVNLHHNANDVGNICPHVAGFTGTITTGAWAAGSDRTVNYRFERSDGTLEKMQTITFPAAGGSKQVVDTWTKGGTGTFWEQLHVVYPTEVSSSKATFSSKCGLGGGQM